MSNKILQWLLFFSSLLVIALFFIYRGFGWPLGRESMEALVAFGVFLASAGAFSVYLLKRTKINRFQENVVKIGLLTGLLWTIEISMNNLLRPVLPGRDTYDDLFWAAIGVIIFLTSTYYGFITKKIARGIQTGFWTGFSSGAVAGITALMFIVFGMSQILLDPLNIAEWADRGAASGTPSISVYFVYQTLAGAVLHLVILGVGMGVLLGVLGGILGKIVSKFR